MHARPSFPVQVHTLSGAELQARLVHYAIQPESPSVSVGDRDEPTALELGRLAPTVSHAQQSDLVGSLPVCVRALIVLLTMCISTCLTLVAVGLVRSGDIYATTQITDDRVVQMMDRVRVIEQASVVSASNSNQKIETTQIMLNQHDAMLHQMLALQQNVTALTQTFRDFVDILRSFSQTP